MDLNIAVTQFRESFDETMDLPKEIIDIVPPSEFFSAYNIIMKNVEAADSYSTQAHVATGAAIIALPDESLALRIPPTQASSSKKRSATVSSLKVLVVVLKRKMIDPLRSLNQQSLGLSVPLWSAVHSQR